MDFSPQYMQWQMAAMLREGTSQSSVRAAHFVSSIFVTFIEPFFVNFFCIVLFITLFFSHVIWLVERNDNGASFSAALETNAKQRRFSFFAGFCH